MNLLVDITPTAHLIYRTGVSTGTFPSSASGLQTLKCGQARVVKHASVAPTIAGFKSAFRWQAYCYFQALCAAIRFCTKDIQLFKKAVI